MDYEVPAGLQNSILGPGNTLRFPATGTIIYSSPGAKDTTQLVPISNIQASSMTPNFSTLRSFFLSGHQKHPKFPDWITAEEIGTPIGLTADQVKKYSTEYCERKGLMLPNNQASQLVKDRGGYFTGVQTLVDDVGLPCWVNEELGAIGVWFLMEDGKIVWRNYWSPVAVSNILSMIPAEKKRLQEPARMRSGDYFESQDDREGVTVTPA